MTGPEIIGAPFSNYVRSIRMLCEEKGVAYTLTPARPHAPEVVAIHPAGQIPVMRHGDVALFESKAIATYIDRAFPGPRFIPDGALDGARVEQWVSFVNAKVDRAIMREFVVPSVFFDKSKGPDTARITAALPQIEAGLGALEAALTKTAYLAGDSLTFADMNVVPILDTFRGFPAGREMLDRFPRVTAYLARETVRPSYVDTTPPSRK